MNMDNLSTVEFGDQDGLRVMFFENQIQHQLFYNILADQNIISAFYPLGDAEFTDLDDWLLMHWNQHFSLADLLSLTSPFELIDTDWNQEDDFNDWVQQHLLIHQNIAATLGV